MTSEQDPSNLDQASWVYAISDQPSRVFAISDLHVDHKENLDFIKSWSNDKYKRDALIVAGDVTDNLALLESTLRILKAKFAEVFYVPGKILIDCYNLLHFKMLL